MNKPHEEQGRKTKCANGGRPREDLEIVLLVILNSQIALMGTIHKVGQLHRQAIAEPFFFFFLQLAVDHNEPVYDQQQSSIRLVLMVVRLMWS